MRGGRKFERRKKRSERRGKSLNWERKMRRAKITKGEWRGEEGRRRKKRMKSRQFVVSQDNEGKVMVFISVLIVSFVAEARQSI